MKPILIVGETNVDLVLHGAGAVPTPGHEVTAEECVLTLGSASAICAAGLARLGNRVIFVSRAGADVWGDHCVQTLNARGVDTSRVIRDPALKTGVTVSISSPSDRALVTYVGSIAEVKEEDVTDELLDAAGHLHVSSFFLQAKLRGRLAHLFERARQRGVTTSLDPGFDPENCWQDLEEVARSVDVFLPNEVELRSATRCATPESALRALDGGRTRTVVKLGAAGAMTLDGGRILHVPGFAVEPVDTTGAGDSFNAGFLHAFVRGRPISECLLVGNACGAASTRALGGITAQPTIAEVNALIHAAQERR